MTISVRVYDTTPDVISLIDNTRVCDDRCFEMDILEGEVYLWAENDKGEVQLQGFVNTLRCLDTGLEITQEN